METDLVHDGVRMMPYKPIARLRRPLMALWWPQLSGLKDEPLPSSVSSAVSRPLKGLEGPLNAYITPFTSFS